MKLLLINGAPQSGKDTIGQHAYDVCESHYPHMIPCVERVSFPLKAAFAAIMETELDDSYQLPEYESRKDDPIPVLGVSCRQFQIDMSEKLLKPCYGTTVLARLLLSRIANCTDDEVSSDSYHEWFFIVPDCGFQAELDAILDSKKFGYPDIHLINVHRPGHLMDSRELVVPPSGIRRTVIYNTSTIDHLYRETEAILTSWMPLSAPAEAHTEGTSA